MTADAAESGRTSMPSVDDGYREFVAGLELQRIDTLAVRAERLTHGEMDESAVALDSSFAVDAAQSAVFYKYDVNVTVSGQDDARLGEVEVTVVLVFRAASLDVPVELVERFGATAAYMMGYPYLREAVSTLAARVGFPGLMLPVVRP